MTASLTQHNKLNISPQRLYYETQSFPGKGSVSKRGQVSRALPVSTKWRKDGALLLLGFQLPAAAVIDLKFTSLPRGYLKSNFTILNSLLSYSPIFPNSPHSHPHLQEDFCIHEVSGNKAYKHSYTNKLPELIPAYNCVLVGAFPVLSPVLRSE